MTEGFVDTNGVALWHQRHGQAGGLPVVLIHGVEASSIWWPPELVDSLVAAGHEVVVFDNRDIGLSTQIDFDESPYGIDEMAQDTIGLLDGLGVERAHLVGVSMGGMISQVVATSSPERVASLTLLSTTPGLDASLSPSDDSVFAGVDDSANAEDLAVAFGRALTGSRYPFDELEYRRYLNADDLRGTNPNSGHRQVVPASPSRVAELKRLETPTLVVHGTEDPIFPFDHGKALATAIPGATLIKWEGVGHEIPTSLVPELARLINEHIASSSLGMRLLH